MRAKILWVVIVVAVFAIMAAVVAAIEEDRSEPEWRVPSPSTSPLSRLKTATQGPA